MSAPATNAFSPAPVKATSPHVVAVAQLGERGAQLGQHLPVERVAHLGAVDRDDGEAVGNRSTLESVEGLV